MARHTKKEFAALCSIETKTLSVYISRDKVIVDDNDLIDDTHPANKEFIQKQQNKKGKPDVGGSPSKPKSEATEPDEEKLERIGYVKMQREKAELDLAAKKNAIALQKIEIEKKRGELVPTESVKTVITLHSESIKTSYTEASDGIIVLFAQKGGLNAEDISDLRKRFKDLVNKAIKDSVEATGNLLDQIVAEFSVKRAPGQHD